MRAKQRCHKSSVRGERRTRQTVYSTPAGCRSEFNLQVAVKAAI